MLCKLKLAALFTVYIADLDKLAADFNMFPVGTSNADRRNRG